MSEFEEDLRPGKIQVVPREETVLTVISRAAADPNVNIDKLERLLAMQERLEAKQSFAMFASAMVEAQSEIGRIVPNTPNDQTKSVYADYAALDRIIRPVYTKCGLALTFGTEESKLENHVVVVCNVMGHGHKEHYRVDMPADGKGAKGGDVMTKTHATGSALTYGMRYLARLIFNLAIGRDDDGNMAGSAALFITADEALELNAMIDENDIDRAAFMKWLASAKMDAIEEIQAVEFERVKKFLQRKIDAGQMTKGAA